MNEASLKVFDSIYNNQLINSLISKFTSTEFRNSRLNNNLSYNADQEEIRKAIWLTSILASSNNEEHIKKAQLFAALLYLNSSGNIDIIRIAYIIFSRTGNLIATKFFKELFENINNND